MLFALYLSWRAILLSERESPGRSRHQPAPAPHPRHLSLHNSQLHHQPSCCQPLNPYQLHAPLLPLLLIHPHLWTGTCTCRYAECSCMASAGCPDHIHGRHLPAPAAAPPTCSSCLGFAVAPAAWSSKALFLLFTFHQRAGRANYRRTVSCQVDGSGCASIMCSAQCARTIASTLRCRTLCSTWSGALAGHHQPSPHPLASRQAHVENLASLCLASPATAAALIDRGRSEFITF